MSSEFQNAVKTFKQKHKLEVSTDAAILDLCSEVGEVAKLAFSETVGKSVENSKWEEELGDALFSVLSVMNTKNIDASKALHAVLAKYEKRFQDKGSIDSGH